MNIYIVMTIAGILGIICHALYKINGINRRYTETDFNKVFQEYWKHDKLALVTSFFCYGMLLFVSSEFVNLNQLEAIDPHQSLKERLLNFRLATFIKTASVIAGYFADSLVYGAMGVAEKRIQKQIEQAKNN